MGLSNLFKQGDLRILKIQRNFSDGILIWFMGSFTVSVVLPTHNRPKFLAEAVKSVIEQTYNNIELIIVDDHSSMPAEEALSFSISNHIDSFYIIRHNKNRGANIARNTGIRNASGNYIAFLDDDDRWECTKIERQVTAIQRSEPEVGLVYTGQRFVNENGKTTSLRVSTVNGDVTKALLSGARIAPFSSIMVSTDVIEEAGLPDERFPSWQDIEWYIRLSEHTLFESISEPLVIRREGEYDQIGDDYETKRDVSYPLMIQKHHSLAKEYGWVCSRRFVAKLQQSLGKSAITQKRYSQARHHFMKSIITYPFLQETYPYAFVALTGDSGYELARKIRRKYLKLRYGFKE